jgi:shikimate dehydrogenase
VGSPEGGRAATAMSSHATPPLSIEQARAEVGPDATLVGVIGSPVAHSLSPLLHNTAFAALGLDSWRSFAFDVDAGQAPAALEAMRRARLVGLSVTMPHKAAVAALVDEASEVARRLAAVNCIHRADDALFGTNTDGEGFVSSLDRGAGFDPAGRRCVVAGAGGAARAVVLALAGAGAAGVAVVNRTPERAVEAAALAGGRGTAVPNEAKAVADAVTAADLVVNATPLGMTGVDDRPSHDAPAWLVAPSLLGEGQLAADLVYVPRPTRWLREAAAAGATVLDGLGMLVHQAAAQLVIWTGAEPPVEAMWQAAEAAHPFGA